MKRDEEACLSSFLMRLVALIRRRGRRARRSRRRCCRLHRGRSTQLGSRNSDDTLLLLDRLVHRMPVRGIVRASADIKPGELLEVLTTKEISRRRRWVVTIIGRALSRGERVAYRRAYRGKRPRGGGKGG